MFAVVFSSVNVVAMFHPMLDCILNCVHILIKTLGDVVETQICSIEICKTTEPHHHHPLNFPLRKFVIDTRTILIYSFFLRWFDFWHIVLAELFY